MTVSIKRDVNVDQDSRQDITIRVQRLGQPLDITGANVECYVKRTYDQPDPLITFDLTHGIVLDGPNGVIYWSILPSDTRDIPFGGEELALVYDLELTLNGDDELRYRLYEGEFNINKNVTVQP